MDHLPNETVAALWAAPVRVPALIVPAPAPPVRVAASGALRVLAGRRAPAEQERVQAARPVRVLVPAEQARALAAEPAAARVVVLAEANNRTR